MEPTNRSNVGNSTGGQNLPPSNGTRQPGYDPIFSPTGRADVHSAPATPTITSGPAPQPVQPIQPVQPLVSAPDPNHTVSTATGDIVLPSSPSPATNKPKLPLIIGLIAAGILIVVGLIILVVNPFSGNSNTPADTLDSSFNKLVNYLHDGSNSASLSESVFTNTDNFEFATVFNSSDQNVKDTYFTDVQQLFQNFQDAYDADDLHDNTFISAAYDAFSSDMYLLLDINLITPLTLDGITTIYLNEGSEATTNYINNYYNDILQSSGRSSSDYVDILLEYDTPVVDYLDLALHSGCINNKQLNQVCVEQAADGSELYNAYLDATTANMVTSLNSSLMDSLTPDLIASAQHFFTVLGNVQGAGNE